MTITIMSENPIFPYTEIFWKNATEEPRLFTLLILNPLHIIHFLIENLSHKTLHINDLHTTTSFIKTPPTLKTASSQQNGSFKLVYESLKKGV